MDGIICIAGISAIAFRILRDVFHLSLVGFAAVPPPVRPRRHNRHRRGVLDGKPEAFRTEGGTAAKHHQLIWLSSKQESAVVILVLTKCSPQRHIYRDLIQNRERPRAGNTSCFPTDRYL